MIKKIIYDTTNGDILVKTEAYQFIDNLFVNESQEYRNNLAEIEINNPPNNLKRYKVIEGRLVEKERELIEPTEPFPSNKELQERIKELEVVIDVILGVDDNAL